MDTEADLFFWKRTGANAEVDYVVQKGESIIPIEVKSNTTGKMQSMSDYLRRHAAPYGIRVPLENFGNSTFQNKQIMVVPVYGVTSIKESKPISVAPQKPTAIGGMTRKQLDAELAKGVESLKTGSNTAGTICFCL